MAQRGEATPRQRGAYGQSPEQHQTDCRHSHPGGEAEPDRAVRRVRPFRACRAGYAHVVTPGSIPWPGITSLLAEPDATAKAPSCVIEHQLSWCFMKSPVPCCRAVITQRDVGGMSHWRGRREPDARPGQDGQTWEGAT